MPSIGNMFAVTVAPTKRSGSSLSDRVRLRPLTPASWRIAPPAARTREPLVVTFPAPLDHGLLARAVGVEGSGGRTIEGDITLEATDTRWVFRPRAAWDPGEYRLVALSILEERGRAS